jgi:dTDP-4-dehydrorhamnose reductase
MSRIVVLGGEGMLGHKMFQILGRRYPGTVCTIRGALAEPFYRRIGNYVPELVIEGVDVMDLDGLAGRLGVLRPEVIVNCIGIVKQRDEAASAIPSLTINSLLPHRLAAAAAVWNGRVFHFSTDCVFSGRRGGYSEDDLSDAEDLYGRTKFLGEVGVANALTLRTSIIGRELSQFRSLLEWFLAQRGGAVRGFTRHLWSGVSTNYLARLVGDLIADHPALHGVYQVSSGTINKYDLLILLRDAFRLDVEITPDDRESCDRSLRGGRFQTATGIICPPWTAMAAELAADPTPYPSWRSDS